MDDLISRQAAIDALSCENPTELYVYYDDAVKAIKEVPSAEPDVPGTNVGDTISRQAVLSFLRSWQEVDGYNWGERNIISAAINEVEALPSAEPEMIREIRKWINSSNRGNADYFIVDKIEEIINKYE